MKGTASVALKTFPQSPLRERLHVVPSVSKLGVETERKDAHPETNGYVISIMELIFIFIHGKEAVHV